MSQRKLSRGAFIKGVTAATLLASSGGVLAACGGGGGGQSVLEKARQADSIKIGYSNEAPWGFRENGELTGASPEIARVIFKDLGVPKIEGVLTEFDGLIPALQANRFDVLTGMAILPERCEAGVSFTDPFSYSATALAVKSGNPMNLNDFADVADRSAQLGVVAAGVEEDYATAAGVKEGQIQKYPDTQSALEALQIGRVDAVGLTSITLRYAVDKLKGGEVETAEPFVPVVDGKPQALPSGFAFRQDDQELSDAFNKKLVEMKNNGRLLDILAPFGWTQDELELAEGKTVKEACSPS